MRTTLQFLGLATRSSYYRMLEQHLDYWQRLTAVTATNVVMERQPRGRASYRVQVRLEVAGGEFHTEAIARTLKAALLLANRGLETQIQARKARRIAQRASHQYTESVSHVGLIDQPSIPHTGRPELLGALPLPPCHEVGLK
jgi:ribosome-associated translation inhibitor RaiA